MLFTCFTQMDKNTKNVAINMTNSLHNMTNLHSQKQVTNAAVGAFDNLAWLLNTSGADKSLFTKTDTFLF